MSALSTDEKEHVFQRIKVMSNRYRFEILLLTQEETPSIAELSARTKLAYNKCADYVTALEKQGLVTKIKDGREVRVKSTMSLKLHDLHFER